MLLSTIIKLIIISLTLKKSKSENKTIFLFEHFRHGARNPTENDNFNISWKGKGELTEIGKRMQYLLGIHNNNKYKNFINENYNPNEILIYSSDKNRTILSGLNQLQGMFNQNTKINTLSIKQIQKSIPFYLKNNSKINKVNNNLHDSSLPFGIQVIPIHLIDNKEKLIKLTSDNNCKVYDKIRKENMQKKIVVDFFNNFNKEYGKDLLDYFNIKKNNTFFNTYKGLEFICGSFFPDYYDRKEIKIKNINNEKLFNSCLNYYSIKYTEIRINDKNNLIGLFSMSKFMRKVLFYIEENVNLNKNNTIKKNNFPKFLIYSGHDTTMSEMQDYFRILFNFKVEFPSYASNLFIEVKKNEKNEFYVDLVFNDKIKNSFKYEYFKKIILSKSWSDEKIAEFCEFPEYKKYFSVKKKYFIFKIVWIILIFLDIVIMIILILFKVKKSDTYNNNIELIPNNTLN